MSILFSKHGNYSRPENKAHFEIEHRGDIGQNEYRWRLIAPNGDEIICEHEWKPYRNACVHRIYRICRAFDNVLNIVDKKVVK